MNTHKIMCLLKIFHTICYYMKIKCFLKIRNLSDIRQISNLQISRERNTIKNIII